MNDYIEHCRNRKYMSGIERDKLRIKQNAEIFTPTPLVIEILNELEKQDPTLFSDTNKTFLDNSCGDGQFLSEVIIKKMERSNCSLEMALKTTYGVDLMMDNVIECRRRLAGPNPSRKIIKIVETNIVCADALKYDYSFKKKRGPGKKKLQNHNKQMKLF
jgi:hypothetical protein